MNNNKNIGKAIDLIIVFSYSKQAGDKSFKS